MKIRVFMLTSLARCSSDESSVIAPDTVCQCDVLTSSIICDRKRFCVLPTEAAWLAICLQERTTFPSSKYDDQADSTSHALDWAKQHARFHPVLEYYLQEALRQKLRSAAGYGFVSGGAKTKRSSQFTKPLVEKFYGRARHGSSVVTDPGAENGFLNLRRRLESTSLRPAV